MDACLCALVLLVLLGALLVYLSWQEGPEHDLAGKVVLVRDKGGAAHSGPDDW